MRRFLPSKTAVQMPSDAAPRRIALAAALLLHMLIIGFLLIGNAKGTSDVRPGSTGSGPTVYVSLQSSAAQQSGDISAQQPAAKPETHPAHTRFESADNANAITIPAESESHVIGGAGASTGNGVSDFRKRLYDHIARFRQYPADTHGAEGQVEVGFVMNRKGKILNLWINHGSGSLAFDRAAVETVLRAQPLPELPSDISDPTEIILPVDFTSHM